MRYQNYAQLATDLRIGHEIEFGYLGKHYSITDHHSKWWFSCDTDGGDEVFLSEFQDKDTLVKAVAAQKLGTLRVHVHRYTMRPMGQTGRYRARKNKSRDFPSTYFFFDPKFICATTFYWICRL